MLDTHEALLPQPTLGLSLSLKPSSTYVAVASPGNLEAIWGI